MGINIYVNNEFFKIVKNQEEVNKVIEDIKYDAEIVEIREQHSTYTKCIHITSFRKEWV